MTDVDLAQLRPTHSDNLIQADYLQSVVWPVLGLILGGLCTVAWCGYLIWLVIGLFS